MLREPASAVALLNPERRRLVEALRELPDSAAGLARRLGEKRQRLNYHLRALEDAGLVAVAEERPRRGFTERVYRVRAERFVVDPGMFGEPEADPATVGDRFSATYLLMLAARAVRELAGLREKAERQGRRLATAGLDTTVRLRRPSDVEAFAAELAEAVGEVVARYHSDTGRPFRLVMGAYPGPSVKDGSEDDRTKGGTA